MKTSKAPERIDGRTRGNETVIKVRKGLEPRTFAASSMLSSMVLKAEMVIKKTYGYN